MLYAEHYKALKTILDYAPINIIAEIYVHLKSIIEKFGVDINQNKIRAYIMYQILY